jgi:hypothetical protein
MSNPRSFPNQGDTTNMTNPTDILNEAELAALLSALREGQKARQNEMDLAQMAYNRYDDPTGPRAIELDAAISRYDNLINAAAALGINL